MSEPRGVGSTEPRKSAGADSAGAGAENQVRAAGGVVVRDGSVLLVHRPQYDDWTLPKGKLDPGESWEDAALREVEEETGLVCELGAEIGRTHYRDSRGRPKEARYFRMTAVGEPRAQNEVDEVRWVRLEEAAALLSYERDRELLKALR
jgi:8-oxo-dGTP diphosphatase